MLAHLFIGAAQLCYEMSLVEKEIHHIGMVKVMVASSKEGLFGDAAAQVQLAITHYWDKTFHSYGHLKLATVFFFGVYFSLLQFKQLKQNALCVPLLILLFHPHVILLCFKGPFDIQPATNQTSTLSLAIDALMLVVIPSMGLPLVWTSQIILCLCLEALQSVYSYRILKMDLMQTSRLLAIRFVTSASIGLVSDFLRRRSFFGGNPVSTSGCSSEIPLTALRNEGIRTEPALASSDENENELEAPDAEAPIIDLRHSPLSPLSRASSAQGSSLLFSHGSPSPYPEVFRAMRVVVKTNHMDEDDAPLPVFDKAELHESFLSDAGSAYSMTLIEVTVRRGCFIVELDLARLGSSDFDMDCLATLEKLKLEKQLRPNARVSVNVGNSQPNLLFELSSDGTWTRLAVSSPPPSQSSLALTPTVFAFDGACCSKVVLRGKWGGPKLNETSSLEAVIGGKAVPVTCTPLCSDWSPGEDMKLVVDLSSVQRSRPYGSLKFNVWSKPTATEGGDLPAVFMSTVTALVLPSSSKDAVEELDRLLLSRQSQGLVTDLGIILDGNIPRGFSHGTTKIIKWATSANCPALSDLISKLLHQAIQQSSKRPASVPDGWMAAQKSLTTKGSGIGSSPAGAPSSASTTHRPSSSPISGLSPKLTPKVAPSKHGFVAVANWDQASVNISWTASISILSILWFSSQIPNLSIKDGSLSMALWTLFSAFGPYYLHVANHIFLSRTGSAEGAMARVARGFQRHAGLILHLARYVLVFFSMALGVKRLNIFGFQSSFNRGFHYHNARLLTFKAVLVAMEPIPWRHNIIQALLLEYPSVFIFSKRSIIFTELTSPQLWFHVLSRALVTISIVLLRHAYDTFIFPALSSFISRSLHRLSSRRPAHGLARALDPPQMRLSHGNLLTPAAQDKSIKAE